MTVPGILLKTSMLATAIATVLVGTTARPGAQSPLASDVPRLEVASIRLNTSRDPVASIGVSPGGLVSFGNVTFRAVIQRAYGVRDSQIVGGPDWLATDQYDVIVRTDKPGTPEQLWPALKTVLADRLKLVVRTEARESPVLALALARPDRQLGPQLRPSSMVCGTPQAPAPAEARPICGGRSGAGGITAGGVTMDELAKVLSILVVERPIIDRTGLTGGFDLDVKWPSDRFPALIDPARTSFVTLLLEQQLGLTLRPTRAPVDFLVIERIERPTEN